MLIRDLPTLKLRSTDFGDAVYFDWAFSQDDITRPDDGSIQVSDGSDS